MASRRTESEVVRAAREAIISRSKCKKIDGTFPSVSNVIPKMARCFETLPATANCQACVISLRQALSNERAPPDFTASRNSPISLLRRGIQAKLMEFPSYSCKAAAAASSVVTQSVGGQLFAPPSVGAGSPKPPGFSESGTISNRSVTSRRSSCTLPAWTVLGKRLLVVPHAGIRQSR